MYEIAICDDDPGYIEHLRGMLDKACDGRPYMIDAYACGEELLNDNNRTHDLVFIDIQMSGMDGNVTARKLRERDQSVVLVFCSGVHRPSPESFKAAPFRYLIKQYADEKTLKDLKEILEEVEMRKHKVRLVASYMGNIYRFDLNDVMYIYLGRRDTSKLHLIPEIQKNFEDEVTVNKKLVDLYADIRKYGFGYAHNSYLVNFRFIKLFNRLELTMLNDEILTIARGKYNDFLSDFLEFSERCVRERIE